jgi:hypothetical protein
MRKIRVFQHDAYLSLDYQNQSGEIYQRSADGLTRAQVEIEREEPLKRQLARLLNAHIPVVLQKSPGLEATAALELAVEITKRIAAK